MVNAHILKGVNFGKENVDLYVWVNESGNIQFSPVNSNFEFVNIGYEFFDEELQLTKHEDGYFDS